MIPNHIAIIMDGNGRWAQRQDLPRIDEALGKIASLKDIEGLSLGLPSVTAASGKKYSAEVLYNPDFIKKLRKVSRSLATPYLPYSSAVSMGGSTVYGK